MVKKDIYDIIIWIGMAILVLYIIGKIIGIINSPEWINLMPIITVAFIVGAFYQKAIIFMNQMYKRTDFLKIKLEEHNSRLNQIEKSKNYL